MGYAWSGLSLEESKAGRQSFVIFGLALLLVYLTLAAQYQSLVLPFIVLLGVPLAVLGALSAQWARGFANDVYCQIGLVMLIGLAAKNSILIVEFAEQLRQRGSTVDGGGGRGGAHPPAADPDDVAGVHPRACCRWCSRPAPAPRRATRSGTAVAGGMLVSTFLNLDLHPDSLRRRPDAAGRTGGGKAVEGTAYPAAVGSNVTASVVGGRVLLTL